MNMIIIHGSDTHCWCHIIIYSILAPHQLFYCVI